MKAIKALHTALLIGGALLAGSLASCEDNYSDPPIVEPAGGVGTGTWDNPMTAYQARLGTINYKHNPAWVHGYVVGVIDTGESTVLNENSFDVVPPFNVETNMLIADDPKPFEELIALAADMETNMDRYTTLRDSLLRVVAPVQLPSGMRNTLGLVTNPDILHHQVCIFGTTGEPYCGENGVRDLTEFTLGEFGNEPGAVPEPEAVGSFYQNFTDAASLTALERSGWRNYVTEGSLGGWTVVAGDGNNYVATDAFNGFSGGGPYEQWLVTPPIDVDRLEHKQLEFESAAMTPAGGCSIEVFAMTKQDPKAEDNVITLLPAQFAKAPKAGYSAWVPSGAIGLETFSGTIYIGWRYRAERGGYGQSVTYCLDNVNIGGAPVPPDWAAAKQFKFMLDGTSDAGGDGWHQQLVSGPSGISNIWSWRNQSGKYYLNGSAYISGRNHAALAYEYSGPISLAGYSHVGVQFEHAARFQTTIQNLGRFVVREAGTQEWTEFIIPTWPAAGGWTFTQSGMIDISAFAGKTVEIGFKYESTDAGADTWEINNLSIAGIAE